MGFHSNFPPVTAEEVFESSRAGHVSIDTTIADMVEVVRWSSGLVEVSLDRPQETAVVAFQSDSEPLVGVELRSRSEDGYKAHVGGHMTADEAEALGRSLIEAAEQARALAEEAA